MKKTKKSKATISVPVSEEVLDEMKMFNIDWTAVANSAFHKKLALLKRFKELTDNSTLTEGNARIIGSSIKKGIARRHGIR